MKTINSFDLLLAARKYTNKSVIRAFIELADKLADFGNIDGDTPDYYGEFRMLVQMEVDGTTEENRNETYRFIPVSEYAEGLDMSEEEMLQELACCGLISAEDSPEFKTIGVYDESIDKGYIKEEGGKFFISPAGIWQYQRWKNRDGENCYKLPISDN